MCAPTEADRVSAIGRGDLHDTLMIRLFGEARPLPETVPTSRVRALHQSEVVSLVGDVLKEQVGAWEERISKLYEELSEARAAQVGQETRAVHAEQERDALASRVRDLEAALRSQQEEAEETLAQEQRDKYERTKRRNERILSLERVIRSLEDGDAGREQEELRLSLERARAAGRAAARRNMAMECELEALRGAARDRAEGIEALEQINERLRERISAGDERARALDEALTSAQRAFDDAWSLSREQDARILELVDQLEDRDARLAWSEALQTELTARTEQLEAHQEHAAALQRERETVNAALSSATEALESLRGELHKAREVQRLSKRLGTLTAPRGADHLRAERADYVLFAQLHSAQDALKGSHERIESIERELNAMSVAVRDEAAGGTWLRRELFKVRAELHRSRQRAAELEKERWTNQEALEARTAEVSKLERDLIHLEKTLGQAEATAEAAHYELADFEELRRELDEACQELESREVLCAAAQAQLTLARTQKLEVEELRAEENGEALRALQMADEERAALGAKLEDERSKRVALEAKIARLQAALHRDRGAA